MKDIRKKEEENDDDVVSIFIPGIPIWLSIILCTALLLVFIALIFR